MCASFVIPCDTRGINQMGCKSSPGRAVATGMEWIEWRHPSRTDVPPESHSGSRSGVAASWGGPPNGLTHLLFFKYISLALKNLHVHFQ